MPSTPAPSAPAYAALSVAGRVREHNEDALLCSSTLGLWAVADGMGGHQCGEVASATALAALEQHIQAGADLPTAVHGANEAVLAVAAEGGEERRGMGTTLVALHLQGDAYQLAWAGDSRCYLIDASGIRQISHDHSWVQMLVDLGQLTPSRPARTRVATSSPSASAGTTRPWKSAAWSVASPRASCCCCAATASATNWTTPPCTRSAAARAPSKRWSARWSS